MIRVTLAKPDGTATLVYGLTGEDLDALANGQVFELDLREARTDGREITTLSIVAKATQADLMEELAPLLAKAKEHDDTKGGGTDG